MYAKKNGFRNNAKCSGAFSMYPNFSKQVPWEELAQYNSTKNVNVSRLRHHSVNSFKFINILHWNTICLKYNIYNEYESFCPSILIALFLSFTEHNGWLTTGEKLLAKYLSKWIDTLDNSKFYQIRQIFQYLTMW